MVSAEKTLFWNWVPVMIFRYRQAQILIQAVWLLSTVLTTTICMADDYQAIRSRAIQLFPQQDSAVAETLRQADQAGVAVNDVSLILSRSAEASLTATDFMRLMATVTNARQAALPTGPFTEKIMEGFAKEVDPNRMIEVLERKLETYQAAKKIVAHITPQQQPNDNAVSSLALAIERGVSPQGLRDLFETAGYEPTAIPHAAQSLADLESMGFTQDEGLKITQAGLKAGYLGKSASSITLIAARGQKLGLSNQEIAETITTGFKRGLPLAEISVELHRGGPGSISGGRMRGGRSGQGQGAVGGSGANGNGLGGGGRSNRK
jgi:hypothetical protein